MNSGFEHAVQQLDESNRALVADARALMSKPCLSRAYLEAVHEMNEKLGRAGFRSRVQEYKAAKEYVRLDGAVIVIEYVQSMEKERAITADVGARMIALVKAIVAGMTLQDHLESDSPQTWLDRQSAETE